MVTPHFQLVEIRDARRLLIYLDDKKDGESVCLEREFMKR